MFTEYTWDTTLQNLEKIAGQKPLILNLTNWVSIHLVANGELAIGASPVMSNDTTDALELSSQAQAILMNIGMVQETQLNIMLQVAKHISQQTRPIPIILDLVGYGASNFRIESCHKLIQFADVIKGNAAEIYYLVHKKFFGQGVDGHHPITNPQELVKKAAQYHNAIVVMTGVEDWISDGKSTVQISGGHPWLGMVTGMGCLSGALLAASVAADLTLPQCITACLLEKVAAEQAKVGSAGPYSMQNALLDAIFHFRKWLQYAKKETLTRVKIS